MKKILKHLKWAAIFNDTAKYFQSAITSSKSTMETPEQYIKFAQS